MADQLRILHHGDAPLLLPNAWDPLSAAIVAAAGFPAVATASSAVALSRGYDDGEQLPFDELVTTVRRIATAVEVPVSVDFERGYGATPDDVRRNTVKLVAAGGVGVNIEDSVDHETLRPVEEQCERISVVRAAGLELGVPIVINARTDAFIVGGKAGTEAAAIAVSRLGAYREAGADCVYPILCDDLTVLDRIHQATEAPINVMLRPSTAPLSSLMDVGVRRISMGPGLLAIAAGAVGEAARRMASGDLDLIGMPRVTTTEMRQHLGI
ncbi:MAG: isocitrate lyase/phosphoenolpyruvate mutase family protein [Actinobacteria bacterium]|nr:isocitrate lyase/phosphoenolpyruvate mutase family protein [Actinomycetota bacterium]MBU1494876.1 isocitrate lyase/phosphoenolpyruvate mutase family protein [Actinomycetota bacterium]